MNIKSVSFVVNEPAGLPQEYKLTRLRLVPNNELILSLADESPMGDEQKIVTVHIEKILSYFTVTNEHVTARLIKARVMDIHGPVADYENMVALLTQG